MNIFKASILTASIIGIISTLVDFAAPSDGLKNQLKMIITMVLILGLFAPFLGGGFKFSLESIKELGEDSTYQATNKSFNDYYIEITQERIEKQILNNFKSEDISVKKVSISVRLSEYNALEIYNLSVTYDSKESNENEISKSLKKILPDTEFELIQEENSEVS